MRRCWTELGTRWHRVQMCSSKRCWASFGIPSFSLWIHLQHTWKETVPVFHRLFFCHKREIITTETTSSNCVTLKSWNAAKLLLGNSFSYPSLHNPGSPAGQLHTRLSSCTLGAIVWWHSPSQLQPQVHQTDVLKCCPLEILRTLRAITFF